MSTAIVLGSIVIVLFVLIWILRRGLKQAPPEGEPKVCRTTGELCCGGGDLCIHKSLGLTSAAVSYFDDEELDRYASRRPSSYTEEEIAEFRYVLDTLAWQETSAWLKSLSQRSISLPIEVYREAMSRISSSEQ